MNRSAHSATATPSLAGTLGEHQIPVRGPQREAVTEILERDIHREPLEPLTLGLARPAHQNSTPSESTAA